MPIVLSHETALAFWELPAVASADAAAYRPLKAPETEALLQEPVSREDAATLATLLAAPPLSQLPRPVSLLTGLRASRRVTRLAHVRCMQAALPAGALLELGVTPAAASPIRSADVAEATRVHVCSPELVFVQMTAQLDDWELAALGFELCGTWARAVPDSPGTLATPLSTPDKLLSFAQAADNMTGAKRARRLARYVLPGARSHEEALIALLSCLPRALGGMGAKPAVLGAQIEAPDVVARIVGSRTLMPDLYWPEGNIALEYDHRLWQDDERWGAYERRKRNAYALMGIELVSLRRDDLSFPDTVRAAFERINRKTGKRLKPANEKQRAQQDALLAWLRER